MGNNLLVLIIVLIALSVMFFMLYINYKLSTKLNMYENLQNQEKELDKLELEIKRRNEGIKNIMEYDIDIAYGRGIDNE